MFPLSLQSIATACNGKLVGADRQIDSVTTNSNQVTRGGLFVALIGERFDAHEFAEQAYEQGAAALLVSRQLPIDCPQVIVTDTQIGLGKIGELVRDMAEIQALAITGSSGKTTVKEMLASILSQAGNVLATKGNFNNEIGVPLTLLRLDESYDFGVFELGANHIGEIAYTSALAKPKVALVNNVGDAHLEGFGSRDGIAQAKSEIYGALASDGVAVINQDDDYADYMLQANLNRQIVTFSVYDDSADLHATEVKLDELGCASFVLNYQGQTQAIQVNLPGEHQVANGLAAAAMALQVGLSLSQVASGLSQLAGVPGRMQLNQRSDVCIVDDSYNANPASVKAAIDWLAKNCASTSLVLGDCAELGDNAPLLHREMGEYAKTRQVDRVFSLGSLSAHASAAADGQHFDDIQELQSQLLDMLRQRQGPQVIVVKGSRSARMERVVQYLLTAFDEGEWQ
ncbi:UDP-N-acetylmuramoyl-tripeptide--D-alanyl-D-alanine ligase [Paraferrimonas sedimenticola]|uniref:UDP-N-acetylmuramoyl-tripeptide--D-alanyl-D-alanine ligase n=1 Tax=Paraferrimonas sedimenticola TaxID=375674 RepID=A0AA37RYA2_9GAMM|nr:UDP-N-acetylmuramoyl-tripeptide--D-alanyl-D-alanine ligase [Paraferrimonas sedimenticola]GLP97503.1 UDP-N-acetylmuramoyl-tripeptide--D-alanyl-D-alanine ligase [Paraferrimonas sedimenticola]